MPKTNDQEALREALYAAMPAIVILDRELSAGAVRLYGLLRLRKGQNSIAYPGYESIKRDMDISQPTLVKHLSELAARHYMKREKHGYGNSNTYTLPRMESVWQEMSSEQQAQVRKALTDYGFKEEHLAVLLGPPSSISQVSEPVSNVDGLTSQVSLLVKEVDCKTVQGTDPNIITTVGTAPPKRDAVNKLLRWGLNEIKQEIPDAEVGAWNWAAANKVVSHLLNGHEDIEARLLELATMWDYAILEANEEQPRAWLVSIALDPKRFFSDPRTLTTCATEAKAKGWAVDSID